MVPMLIQTPQELQDAIKLVSGLTSLFWIVEYSPQELGYNFKTKAYDSDLDRFTFLRTECLKNPLTYQDRLNEHRYRIWTVVPQDYEW